MVRAPVLSGGLSSCLDSDQGAAPPAASAATATPTSAANFIRPGKRPLSSMSPTIVLQDALLNGSLVPTVRAVVGGSGGPGR